MMSSFSGVMMAKVLVVDDDEDIRSLFQQMISAAHHDVFVAMDAEEAKSIIISEEDLDIAIVDRILPGDGDGLDVLEFIKINQPLCRTVLLSGHPTFNSASKAIHHKAFDYLTKPVRKNRLYEVIDAAVKEKNVLKGEIFAAEKNKKGYEELRSKQEMLRHDKRSLLIGINGFINLLVQKTSLDEKQFEYCRQIRQCSIQLETMVNTYLNMSNFERGDFQLTKTKFSILDLIRQSRNALGFLADEKNVEITLMFNRKKLSTKDVLEIEGDRMYLQNAINNLLKNAIEASPPGNRIEIRIKELRDYISISIHNWGTIPDDVRYTFFEKYASSGKKSGLGLGTYIVKLIVKAHDGKTTFRSSDTEGTDISILLPYGNVREMES